MKQMRILVLAAAVVAALPAMAQQMPYSPFYIGAGIGRGNLNVSGTDLTGLDNATVDDSSNAYTFRMGWRVSPYMALEAGYYDLGKYQFAGQGAIAVNGEAKAKSYGLALVGIMPIQNVDLYGRLGYVRSEIKTNASSDLIATNYNAKDKQSEATYGLGARWNMTREWGLFVEWMKNDKIEVDSYLFGVDFKF